MKVFSTLAIAATMALGTQAVVVNLCSDQNCQNPAGQRNVYDTTCTPISGFQSFSIDTYGGSLQKLIVWSRNACAGDQTNKVCAQGRYKPALGPCFRSYNGTVAPTPLAPSPALLIALIKLVEHHAASWDELQPRHSKEAMNATVGGIEGVELSHNFQGSTVKSTHREMQVEENMKKGETPKKGGIVVDSG